MTPLAATEAERLEPCPFCQGTARIEDHRLSWSVHCNSCTACVLGERAPEPDGEMPDSYYAVFRQTAVTTWNRRASQQSAAQATADPVAWRYQRDTQSRPGIPDGEWKWMGNATALELQGKTGFKPNSSFHCWEPLYLAAPDRAPSTDSAAVRRAFDPSPLDADAKSTSGGEA